ncbi:MAG: hypothetical protein GXC73_18970, partial [Chitinophagaceae bacterium]|nr:hypothetical protein [Chitinophagaceae bacterium]
IVDIRMKGGLDLVRNEKNIFSDAVMVDGYLWNHHKAEVHKNYLVSLSRMLTEISSIADFTERKKFVLAKIQNAMKVYKDLEERKIYLTEESGKYHLGIWESFMKSKLE